MDLDFLDAYKLTINNTHLFGNYEACISEMGVPSKVTHMKIDLDISSKAALDQIVSTAKNFDIVTLHYPGIEMWFVGNDSMVPSIIDFRKTRKSITYGQTTFDMTYSIEQFHTEFPTSANPPFKFPQSLFEMATKENGVKFEHYMLMRNSKDDPSAMPMVQFTCEDGKLIFILFANF